MAGDSAGEEDLDGFEITVDALGGRADIVLNRPPLNIISMPQRAQMRRAFERLNTIPEVRVIVLRAKGEHFTSGGQIVGFLTASPEELSHLAWNVAAPARCTKPVIAASRGYCFGVGFELALNCDFRLVSETCLYALPEQKLAQVPGSGGSARLQGMIGMTRTKDMIMRAKRISGRLAAEWGIATECVADGELESATDALVNELRGFSPIAQRAAKKLLNHSENASLPTAIELEGQTFARLRMTEDFREGVEAFTQKRAPRFREN